MRIPEIQTRLLEIARENGMDEVASLALQLTRRSPKKRAPASSKPMTAKLAHEIREFSRSNPDMTQAAIGRVFNINQGRVSEAVRGFRQ